MVNVGKYTVHGVFGYFLFVFVRRGKGESRGGFFWTTMGQFEGKTMVAKMNGIYFGAQKPTCQEKTWERKPMGRTLRTLFHTIG